MTKDEFKKLRPGDTVYYRGAFATVSLWLEEDYFVEFTSGTNLKITDNHLPYVQITHKAQE